MRKIHNRLRDNAKYNMFVLKIRSQLKNYPEHLQYPFLTMAGNILLNIMYFFICFRRKPLYLHCL